MTTTLRPGDWHWMGRFMGLLVPRLLAEIVGPFEDAPHVLHWSLEQTAAIAALARRRPVTEHKWTQSKSTTHMIQMFRNVHNLLTFTSKSTHVMKPCRRMNVNHVKTYQRSEDLWCKQYQNLNTNIKIISITTTTKLFERFCVGLASNKHRKRWELTQSADFTHLHTSSQIKEGLSSRSTSLDTFEKVHCIQLPNSFLHPKSHKSHPLSKRHWCSVVGSHGNELIFGQLSKRALSRNTGECACPNASPTAPVMQEQYIDQHPNHQRHRQWIMYLCTKSVEGNWASLHGLL